MEGEPNFPENRKSTETEIEEVDLPQESELLNPSLKFFIAVGLTVLYLCLWGIWLTFNSKLWPISIDISIHLAQVEGFLWYYCWTFAEVFYKWYMLIIGILLVFAPRKDRAWTSIATFLLSYTARQYLRLLAEESRPQYDSTEIRLKSCNCSFGMPSGHSEGSTMLYSLLIYNFMSAVPSTKERVLAISCHVWITSSVYFSRIYFGRHSFLQIFLGALQGYVFFFWMLCLERPLNAFFRRFLAGGKPEATKLLVLTGVMAIASPISWFLYFEGRIENLKIPHVTCDTCFLNNNQALRMDLGRALTFPFIGFVIVLGTIVYKPTYCIKEEYVKQYIDKNLSALGFKRGVLMLLCYAPLLLTLTASKLPQVLIPLALLLNMISGYLLGQLPSIFGRLELLLDGDVVPDSEMRKLDSREVNKVKELDVL